MTTQLNQDQFASMLQVYAYFYSGSKAVLASTADSFVDIARQESVLPFLIPMANLNNR